MMLRARTIRLHEALIAATVLILLLVASVIVALRDGTNRASVVVDLPKSLNISHGDIAYQQLATHVNDASFFSLTSDTDSNVEIDCLNRHICGELHKDWTRGELTYCYVLSENYMNENEPKYYVRVVFPKDFGAGVPKEIAFVLHNIDSGTAQSHWFTLNHDGTALVGDSETDYEELVQRDRKNEFETEGTWKLESESQSKIIRVETGKEIYTIQYND